MTINLDMDGTIANLYACTDWLEQLRVYSPAPYKTAQPLVNMSLLARYIHKVQAKGIQVNIISWLSKTSTEDYDQKVTQAKIEWLRRHLPSVYFDAIYIIPHGTPKSSCVPKTADNILVDDELQNLTEWENAGCGKGVEPCELLEIFKDLIK